jgi:CRP-like cAMP-binding protein
VRALDDVRVLEITSERFREVAMERPGVIEHISGVVSERRIGLDQARAAAAAGGNVATARRTLFGRIQQFLRLP